MRKVKVNLVWRASECAAKVRTSFLTKVLDIALAFVRVGSQMKMRAFLLFASFLLSGNAFAAWHELLQNNGFEEGATAWSAYYLSGSDPLSAGIVDLGNAHTGNWYAYVGDYNTSHFNALGVVRQIVTIPAQATTISLNFYLNVTSQETTTVNQYDTMGAYLRTYPSDNVAITFHQWSNLDKDPNGIKTNYTQYSYVSGVSSYAGQQMDFQFYGQTDGSLSTTFRIDDVSLQAYVPDYTISASAGSNGSISPSENSTVESGQTISFSAIPAQNYTVDQWYVDGVSVQTGGSTCTLLVNSSVPVLVTFKPILYALNIQVYGSGTYTISPSGGSYAAGTPIMITAYPQSGYQFSEWTGVQYSRSTNLSFAKGGADENIQLHFVPILVPSGLNLTIANSTPSALGINLPTPASWVALYETSPDMFFWNLTGVVFGQGLPTPIQPPGNLPALFIRTSYSPEVTTLPFLSFPIHTGDTPFTAPVTAIMDHVMADPSIKYNYDKDHEIRTCEGNTYPVLTQNRGAGLDFAILPSGTAASTIFNYRGVTTSGQSGPGYLQYDGHPGYDYAYGYGTDVYAAHAGTVMTDEDLAGSNLAGTGMASYYMTNYHALIVNCGNGYCTIYMHLSIIDSPYVNTSDPNNWKPLNTPVAVNAHIGQTGDFDKISPIAPHFHFEVWRLDGGAFWNYADPYGYSGSGLSGGVLQITPNLWLGN